MLLAPPTTTASANETRSHGPLVLVALCLVPVALWAAAEPLGDRFAGSYVALNGLAVLLAATGMTAFGLNLVLGARLRVVARLFGGLDRMYAVHRGTGESAFVLLLGHVVLVLSSRATISSDSAVELLGPGAGWTTFAGVIAFAAMSVSILLSLFARLGHEVFIYIQRSFGIIFLLGSYHAFTTDSAAGSSALTAHLATVATAGLAAFSYRSVFGRRLVRRRPYRVVRVNRLDDSVTEIVMEPLGKPLVYQPGQFLFVSFRSLALRDQLHPFELSVERQVLSVRPGETVHQFHPFSITSAPDEPTLRITVKALGDYTRALRQLEAGADAVVEGPYGSFMHRGLRSRQVWAAGGIGVTPFLSMARSLPEEDKLAVDLYYCVEHEDEAHFLDELRAIEARRAGFTVTVVPRDREGFLTGARLASERSSFADTDVLVCGPPGMIESLRSQLAAEGLPSERFHAEEFSFAKVGGGSARSASGVRLKSDTREDTKLIAVLGGLVVLALVFALGVAVGGSIAG
jgi:predicted ferric reductase